MEKKLNKTKVAIAILILVILIIIISITMAVLISQKTHTSQLEDGIEINEETIEDILKYFDCTDIEVKNSDIDGIDTDIYLRFSKPLWEGSKSNETYFNELFIYVNKKLDGKSYRLIDSSREIVIVVLCDKESKRVKAIYINGDPNYFTKETSKKKNETIKYLNVKTVNMDIESREITELINNEWNADTVNFGSLESRFDDYDIYFDEGLEIRTVGAKIYNIVFTSKYKNNIVNGLKVSSNNEQIKNALGEPAFDANGIIRI